MLSKRFALGFGIAIIFPMMIHYGVSVFFPRPTWDYLSPTYFNQAQNSSPEDSKRRMEEFQKKQAEKLDEMKSKMKYFDEHLFYFTVPAGLIAIVLGAFMSGQAVGTGLMFGGILSICDGYVNYWSELAASWKFFSLVLAFVVLLFVGYKKLEKKEI